jgi:peptidyl-tRNA hydrolase, PTH1 family
MGNPDPKSSPWVIVGLGNPGEGYAGTRHNIGFLILDQWASDLRLCWKNSLRFRGLWCKGKWRDSEVYFLKPQTFMNASGRSIQAMVSYLKASLSSVVVVYDDYTLPLGRLKLSMDGGDSGHNGIKDIRGLLGDGFVRFRVGIGSRPDKSVDLKDYVLGAFDASEQATLADRRISFRDSMDLLLSKGPVLAMNQINQNKPNL